MSSAIRIAPSILAADFARLGEQVQAAEAGGADWIHVDVMDGRFVPNITMGPLVVQALRRVTRLPLDVHLMIVEPERHIDAFAEAGADHISIHLEATPNVHRSLMHIIEKGCRAGIAINPHSVADSVGDLLDLVTIINVMTVNPGFGGQKYLGSMSSKLKRLRQMIGETGREIDLQVDGGINRITAQIAVAAGANVLVAGSSVFGAEQGIAGAITELRAAAASA